MTLHMMNRRSLLALAGSAPLLSGCFYDQFFDVEWDEEVLLHDGRVMVIHVKRKYERMRQSLLRYNPDDIHFRGVEIGFNVSPSQRVSVRTRQPLGCVDQFGLNWFLVISGQGPFGASDESPTRWGRDFTTNEQRLAKLDGAEFLPVQWEEAPPELRYLNLVSNLFFPEFVEWNGGKLTIQMKDKFREKHQFPKIAQITRPIRMNGSLGVKQ